MFVNPSFGDDVSKTILILYRFCSITLDGDLYETEASL